MVRSTDSQIELKFPCKPEFVRTIRRAVADFAESFNVPESVIAEIEVAASEAVTNVIRHAYSAGNHKAPVFVRCCKTKTDFTVEVIDNGHGFSVPPKNLIPDVDIERDGGYGIVLMRNLMDSVNYDSGPNEGTHIRMTKRARRAIARSRLKAVELSCRSRPTPK